MPSKCSACGIKLSRFAKEKEVKGLLSNLGIKTPLSKVPLLNVFILNAISLSIKTNKIMNKFLRVGTFMPEMHLKQPGFT